MQNNWVVFEVGVSGDQVDLAGALLAEVGCQGTVVEERQLDTFVVPDGDLDPAGRYQLKAYFADPDDPEDLHRQLRELLSNRPALAGISIGAPARVRMEDWAESWKQNFSTIRIGSRLIIRPSWEAYQAQGEERVIEIDPGMAFGTGTHGTTLLCLEVIAELLDGPSPPRSLLDVGTGSGILALGAAALGCPAVLANDIDPLACQVARENVTKNGFENEVQITEQPLERLAGQFDLVVANILAEENIRLRQALVEHVHRGGWLVLSGILQEKAALVREAFDSLDLQSYPARIHDDWVCLLYRRI